MNIKYYFFILLLIPIKLFASNEVYSFETMQQQELFNTLTNEIRCVVCQNQNIADSNAPLANDLREKVYEFVLAHKEETEIKEYLVKRYGEFILLKPRVNFLTLILWIFPLLAVLLLALLLSRQAKLNGK